MRLLLYHIGIYIYGLAIKVASTFSAKAKDWVEGRKNSIDLLTNWKLNKQSPIAWFHCASTGEYEQCLPILRRLKKRKPDYKIVVTFFSPSGYHQVQDAGWIDLKLYIPLDTPYQAQEFIRLLQPSIAIFVKAEFWVNHLLQLDHQKIPTLHVAGVFSDNSYLYRPIFKKALKTINYFFVQDIVSYNNLKSHGFHNVAIGGDPRVERVLNIKKEEYTHDILSSIAKPIIIYGSIWKEDLPVVKNFIQKNSQYYHVIAPHDLSSKNLKRFNQSFSNTSHTLIIDTMGELKYLYRYAIMAYIGGGFGAGIHNTLEPAVYEIPIIFGPKYHKFVEAKSFIDEGIARSVTDQNHFIEALQELIRDADLIKVKLSHYFNQQNKGNGLVIDKIIELI